MSENLVEEYLDSVHFFDEDSSLSLISNENVSMLVGLLAVNSITFNGHPVKSLAQILQSKERTNKDIDCVVRCIAQYAF